MGVLYFLAFQFGLLHPRRTLVRPLQKNKWLTQRSPEIKNPLTKC